MSKIEVLKEQARSLEQNEEWRKALDLYQRAITRLKEEDDADIGLYNRVGDLYVRLGDVDPAVKAFEQAVELYVEAELPNNAIAVCKKILRNVPGRDEVFLRMGQIRAGQGFLVDARSHFLTYAERMQAGGQLDEALRALVEFADAAPGDTEIRLAIAGHFRQHERDDEAVEQLVAGYRASVDQGLEEQAEIFAAQLQELRPDADPDALVAALVAEEAALDPGTVDLPGADGVEVGAADDSGEAGGPPAEWDYGEVQPLDEAAPAAGDAAPWGGAPPEAGGETAGTVTEPPLDGGSFDTRSEAVEEVAADRRAPGAEEEDAAPAPHAGPDEIEEAYDDPLPLVTHHDVDGTVDGVTTGDPNDVRDLDPVGDLDHEDLDDDDDLDAELPLLHLPGEDLSGPDDDVRSGSEPEVEDSPSLEGAGVGHSAFDRGAEVEHHDDGATGAEAEVDAEGEAVGVVRSDDPWAEAVEDARGEGTAPAELDPDELARRIAETPDDVELRQREVERAHRSGDEQALIEAYLGLGGALRRAGAERRARAVLREVLQLDPSHEGAKAALAEGDSDERAVAEVASSEDYVDLGALILGDDDQKTTRFVVAYEEPSGDEEADFAKMLSQFKAKVAENVDAADVTAHYDLGTAYKEMGLLDEAVEEFQAALRASADHLPTYEMLGQTFLERGTPETAVRVLSRALEVDFEVEDELLGIYYYTGRAHEACGNKDDAREFYERVFSLDINFADVTERLRALR